LVICVLAAVLIIRYLDAAKKRAPASVKTAVTTATASKGNIGVYLDAIGTVTPVYTASISP